MRAHHPIPYLPAKQFSLLPIPFFPFVRSFPPPPFPPIDTMVNLTYDASGSIVSYYGVGEEIVYSSWASYLPGPLFDSPLFDSRISAPQTLEISRGSSRRRLWS